MNLEETPSPMRHLLPFPLPVITTLNPNLTNSWKSFDTFGEALSVALVEEIGYGLEDDSEEDNTNPSIDKYRC